MLWAIAVILLVLWALGMVSSYRPAGWSIYCMWLWGREMETYVAEKAGKVLDRGGEALRRADDFLQDTRAHVSEALS
jgi:hypothetical protein